MPSYRLDEASTGRAGCQNKECKDDKIKILKGELRLGTWVDTERFQSFFWRHWGCVTPKIIAHMKETVEETGEDVSDIDGFQELSPENQEKVRKAVEQGHVDDDDWKGDVEMNRPGKTGFRMRVPKKKAKADEEEEVSEAREQPAKPKKRGQAKPAKDAAKSGSEDEAPKTKQPKKRGRAKQDVVDDDESAKQPAKKGRASKDTTEKKTTKTSTASTPAAKSNAKRQKKPANEDGEAEAKLVPADEKPKRGRKKKSM